MWMLAIALLVPALLLAWWSSREATIHYTFWKYSREFKPGMMRKQVEDRLITIHPDFHRFLPPATDYVDLGWVWPGVCSVTEIIALDFRMPDPRTIDDNDTLIRVELRQMNWGCM
jgi:hypothetical protein